MLKIKKQSRLALVAVVIFSLLTMYLSIPMANAASLTSAKDTLSDSDTSAFANHAISFNTWTALAQDDYMEVTLDADFGDILGGATCSTGNVSTTTNTVRCTATGAVATGTMSITIANVQNPGSEGFQDVTIETRTAANALIESAGVKVFVISDVQMTATVPATLSFAISPVANDVLVNGASTTAQSATTTIAFGTIQPSTRYVMAQKLAVSTNATAGFAVTVMQDEELTSAAGNNINSFRNSPNGTGSTTPQTWAPPAGTLDSTETYGHMGLTTDDDIVAFNGSKFAGLNATDPMTVFTHNGPADGLTAQKGTANVAYSLQISNLQEAGEYDTYLTYVCTPTY